jgi:NADPH:quinone reductase-like Zn-dependent oxidoreductase
VLIRVRALGLNRLELYLRLELSQGVTFPRVPGAEATGIVEQCPGGEFRVGACVKQRDRFGDRSILDGFPARLAGAVATLRRVQR